VYGNNSIFDLLALWGAFFNFLSIFTLGALARSANARLFTKRFKESVTATLGPNEEERELELVREVVTGRQGLLGRFSSRRLNRPKPKVDLVSEIRMPLDKMDIRLMDAENFDHMGRLTITKEELYHPSTVFGEVRLFALREHSKKRKAAGIISSFYKQYRQRSQLDKSVSSTHGSSHSMLTV